MENNIKVCPESYLVWAILSTVLCCLPIGIVAIIKSTNVSKEFMAGNYEAAEKASQDAKKWSIISAACGLIFGFIYFVLMFILGFASEFCY